MSRPDWPKRIAFLLVWLLLLFGDKFAELMIARVPGAPEVLARWLRNPRLVWMLALIVIVLAARLRPFAIPVQAVYFLLFIPVALAYSVYRLARLALGFPRTTRRLLTSPRLHLVLWPLTTLSVLATLAGWFPKLGSLYLAVVLSAITISVALAFLFAFSPGALHRSLGKIVVELWRSSGHDIDEKLRSGELARDPASIPQKIKEIDRNRQWGDQLIAYLTKASDPKAAVRMFVILLPALIAALVFLFAVAFQVIEQIAPGSFTTVTRLDFLDFFLYSLSTMLSAEPPGVTASSDLARLVSALQLIASVAVALVLLLVLTSFSPDRYREELDEAVRELQSARGELEKAVNSLQEQNSNRGV